MNRKFLKKEIQMIKKFFQKYSVSLRLGKSQNNFEISSNPSQYAKISININVRGYQEKWNPHSLLLILWTGQAIMHISVLNFQILKMNIRPKITTSWNIPERTQHLIIQILVGPWSLTLCWQTVHHWGKLEQGFKQDRNLETGTEVEAMRSH